MSFNHSLASSVSFDDIKKMGFIETIDGTNDPRGTSYDLRNEKFFITIDAWFEVEICRLNPVTDFIKVQIDDKFDLEQLVNFI